MDKVSLVQLDLVRGRTGFGEVSVSAKGGKSRRSLCRDSAVTSQLPSSKTCAALSGIEAGFLCTSCSFFALVLFFLSVFVFL